MLRCSAVVRGAVRRTSVCFFISATWLPRASLAASQAAVEAEIPQVRNIGIVAHIDAGKTTTTERMLFYAGVVKRLGDVDSGTTTTDFMKEEMDRGITIQSAAVSLRWKQHPINLIDTPGHVDFTVEVERAMRVVDGVVALFDASAGVQAQSYTVLKQSRKFNVPVIAFLNKMDKYNADFAKSVESIRQKLQVEPLLLQFPLYSEDGTFEGVIDVVEQRTYRFSGKHGEEMQVIDLLPQTSSAGTSGANKTEDVHVIEAAQRGRHELISQLTNMDDTLSEQLIEQLDATEGDEEASERRLSPDSIRAAVRRLTLRPMRDRGSRGSSSSSSGSAVMPVLCGASRRDQGVQPLLDAVNAYLPSPLDRTLTGFSKSGTVVSLPVASSVPTVPTVALAFKVTHAMSPKGKRQPLVFIRVYSGKLTPRMSVRNNTRGNTETIDRLYVMHANTPVEVPYLSAGQIGAAFLTQTFTGDTLFAPPAQHILHAKRHMKEDDNIEEVYTLEGIDTPPSAISFSIEAATKHQVLILEEALEELHREDPSLRVSKNNYGNVVVSGMGELHLDIVMSRLQHEYQVNCRLLRAIIEYRETLRAPQRHEHMMGMYNELPYAEVSLELRPLLDPDNHGCCSSSSGCRFVIDKVFLDSYVAASKTITEGSHRSGGGSEAQRARSAEEDLRVVRSCFAKAVEDCTRLGPLAGMPLHGVEVILTLFRKTAGSQLQEKVLAQVARSLVVQALRATPKSDLAILEPMMEVEVHLSEPDYVGNVVNSLNEHNAVTVDVQEDGRSVKAVVAMRNIVRYTMELRKAVKGHANLFTQLAWYQMIEDKAVITRILKNLGITE